MLLPRLKIRYRVIGGAVAPPQRVRRFALVLAALMVGADWLGRVLLFPWQIPAGLVAALMGAPFLIFLLFRQGRT